MGDMNKMETIKTKITNVWENGKLIEKPEEKIEAIIFNDNDGNNIVSIQDLSFMTDVSIQSLKNFITSKHVLHYYIGQNWFVNIEDLWDKSKRILK